MMLVLLLPSGAGGGLKHNSQLGVVSLHFWQVPFADNTDPGIQARQSVELHREQPLVIVVQFKQVSFAALSEKPGLQA